MSIKRMEKKIEKIKLQLQAIGDMRPGSLSKQYNVCGNPKCRCKDPETPRKHGPYYQLSYARKGKSTSQFIKPEFLGEVKQQLKNYKMFKKLTDEWLTIALDLTKEKLRLAKEKNKKEK